MHEGLILVVGGAPRERDDARAALGTGVEVVFLLLADVVAGAPAVEAGVDVDAPTEELLAAADLALRGRRPEAILCNSERNLAAAARLREAYQAPGQGTASATAFCDKLVMKTRLAAAGVAAPRFAGISTVEEALAAAAAWSSDVLIKPRSGFGSRDIRRVRAGDPPVELAATMAGGWMVEAFVEGRLFHVDGVVSGGRCAFVWASEYLTPPLAFADRPGGSCLLDATDPRLPRLQCFALDCLKAMPTPPGCAFHMDVFETPGGELLAGEIASRSAGNRIRGAHVAGFGLDFPRMAYRAQAGLPLRRAFPIAPGLGAGWGSLRMRPGLVAQAPDLSDPPPGIVSPRFHAQVGDVLPAVRGAADSLLSFVVTAEAQDQVRARWREGVAWASERCDRAIVAAA